MGDGPYPTDDSGNNLRLIALAAAMMPQNASPLLWLRFVPVQVASFGGVASALRAGAAPIEPQGSARENRCLAPQTLVRALAWGFR